MSEINETTLVTLNEYTEILYYSGKNKYSISLSAALAKHQFTVKLTALSVDLLITLGERY